MLVSIKLLRRKNSKKAKLLRGALKSNSEFGFTSPPGVVSLLAASSAKEAVPSKGAVSGLNGDSTLGATKASSKFWL